jgi:hypothetical protein
MDPCANLVRLITHGQVQQAAALQTSDMDIMYMLSWTHVPTE